MQIVADNPDAASVETTITFKVRSSSTGEMYDLEAKQTGRGIRFTCTCKAGFSGQHCKHRVAILLNDMSACVDIDEVALERLRVMAKGSPLLQAVEMVAHAEAGVAEAQKDLKRAKKVLSTIMMG